MALKDTFTVETKLLVTGNAIKDFQKFSAIILKVEENLSKLDPKLKAFQHILNGLSETLIKLNPEFNLLKTSTSSYTKILQKFNQSIFRSTDSMGRMRVRAKELKTEMAGLAAVTELSPLSAMGRRVSRGKEAKSAVLDFGLSSAFPTVALGYGAYHTGKRAFEAYSEYQKAQLDLQSFGVPDLSKQAETFANTGAGMKVLSKTDLLKTYRTAYFLTGGKHVNDIANFIANVEAVNRVKFGGTKGASDQQLIMAMKNAEYLSGGDPKRLKQSLEAQQKLFAATGGTLKPSDMRNFLQTARIGKYAISPNELFMLSPIITEMGGHRAGTSLAMMYSGLIGGHMSKLQARELFKFGLLDPSKITFHGAGGVGTMAANALRNQNQFFSTPIEWIVNTLLPALASKGVTSRKDIMLALTRLFPNTSVNFASAVANQFPALQRESQIAKGSLGISASQQSILGTQPFVQARFQKAWSDFNLELGKLVSPTILKGLETLATILESLTQILSTMNNFFETKGKGLNFSTVLGLPMFNLPSKSNTSSTAYSGDVYLDKQKVGQIMTSHLSRQMSKPQAFPGLSDHFLSVTSH